jgi:CelD/BcsL family acetyltransferase involved in cellulose biosynthesis
VQALGLSPGDAVLVPSYHHGSEVQALAAAGLECRFYDIGPGLEPDDDELDGLLDGGVKGLHLIHYLGFPQDVGKWRAWCDERGLLLLEDAAQAWFAKRDGVSVGSVGDLAIFCLYKAIGVPDGAALALKGAPPGPESRRATGAGQLARGHVAWLLQRYEALGELATKRTDGRPYVAEDDFALGDPGSPPTAATTALLPRLADDHAAAVRRANYRILLDALGDRVPEGFSQVPNGASPFAFPIDTGEKERLLAGLRARGIGAVDLWSAPHPALPADDFPVASARRDRTVALPVHQELRPGDLERIVDGVGRSDARRLPDLRFTIHTSFDALEPAWRELAQASTNVFSTIEWARVWWDEFARGRQLLLGSCTDRRGRTVAIVPMYVAVERPLRAIRFVGHGPGDQLGPVCAPEDRGRAAYALGRALDRRELAWDVFLGEQLPGDEAWTTLLGARSLTRDGYPILRFEHSDWDAYLASRSPSFRKETRRTERRLEKEHAVTYRQTESPDTLDEDLDTLFALHRTRWSDEQSPFAGLETFHRAFAAIALERRWLLLTFLEIDGDPVAAWYGFRFAEAQFHYQSGRDPAWDDASVGYVLVTHSVRKALEDGLREYRFLRGRQEYKYHFANTDPGLETVGVARSAIGGGLLAATARVRGIPALAQLRHRFAG